MLGRRNRFHGHGAVRRVYRIGRPARTGLFSLHTLRNEKVCESKVAVVVSRKISKSAVKRNRIRRRIYEVIRLHLPKIDTPTELVVTVYQVEVADMPQSELEAAIDELFKKTRL